MTFTITQVVLMLVALAQVVVATGSTSTLDLDDLTVLASQGNVL